MPAQGPGISTKPYLVRAIYEWCTDSGYRPFIAVAVDERTRVPLEFVRDGEIVLNISAEATDRLHIGNDLLEFDARFGGVARHVSVPIDNIGAIFAQETGHGMAFEVASVPAEPRQAGTPGEAGTEPVAGAVPDDRAPDDADEEPPRKPAVPARRSGRRKTPAPVAAGSDGDAPAGAGPSASDVAPAAGEAAPARRTGTRRPRKIVLRDVSASKERSVRADVDPSDDGDGPGPDKPKPGKPRLTRVK